MAPSCNIGEAVLQAWVALKPQGFSAKEEMIVEHLAVIAAHLLGCAPHVETTPSTKSLGQQLFSASGPIEKPVFLAMLHPQAGEVNFIDFWTACGEASRIIEASSREGLFYELELLRDDVLQQLEAGNLTPRGTTGTGSSTSNISASVFLDNLDRVAALSVRPSFWRAAVMALDGFKNVPRFNILQLTNVFMSWLYEASLWERNKIGTLAAMQRNSDGPLCAPLPLEVLRSARDSPNAKLALASMRGATTTQKGIPVYLHIYDATQDESVQWLNTIMAHEYSPVKFGGAFHAGVEVNDLEWSFGLEYKSTKYGLCCSAPRQHPRHHYRETLFQGNTLLSVSEIVRIIAQILEDYPGEDYHVLGRNCCHFADEFCYRLNVEGVPSWVTRFGQIGAHLEAMLPTTVKDQIYDFVDPLSKPSKDPLDVPYDELTPSGFQWDPLRSSLSDYSGTSSSDES